MLLKRRGCAAGTAWQCCWNCVAVRLELGGSAAENEGPTIFGWILILMSSALSEFTIGAEPVFLVMLSRCSVHVAALLCV